MIRNPNFDSTTGEEAGGQKINNHNHDGIGSVKIKPYNVIPSYVMTNAQLTYYLSRPAIEGDEFNVYNSDTAEYIKYIRVNKTWSKVGGALLGAVASDNVKDELLTERSYTMGSSATPKQIRINRAGTVRVSFAIHSNTNYPSWAAHVRVNGTNINTIYTATPYVYTTYTYDVSVGISDIVDFTTDSYTGNCTFYIKDFKVSYDETTLTDNILIN